MAKEKDWLEEEQGCAECGELDYTSSKVPGLCVNCCPLGFVMDTQIQMEFD